MPTYVYRCPENHQFERILPLARFNEVQYCPICQATASRVIVAPAVLGDYPGYQCPVSGQWIEGRKAHNENLARTGCRVLEPGETAQASRRAASVDQELEAKIDQTVMELVTALPPEKKVQLEQELTRGVSAEVTRL